MSSPFLHGSSPTLNNLGTGEHGVGLGKREYLNEELGSNTVDLMKTIKKTVDPLGIMNPGKVCALFAKPIFFLHV